MKNAFLTLTLMTGSALAADLPSSKGPATLPPPPLWTGFYLGLNAGGAWSDNNSVQTATFPIFDAIPAGYGTTSAILGTFSAPANASGFIGGGQIGYDYQFGGAFVAGVEADIQGVASSDGSSSVAGAAFNPVVLGGSTASQLATVGKSLDYLGTARGRLGYLVTPTLLVFGSSGLAYGGVSANTSIFQSYTPVAGATNIFASGSYSGARAGWTAGGGLEWMFVPNWSAKAEYLYYDLGNVTYSVAPMVSTVIGVGALAFSGASHSSTSFRGNIVRAGVNYHFNWGAAPLVAGF
ncbi:outer membrane protein [Methylocystis sp. ATCC 49242]|uniref:outer membrane protein n=1 Tax=Methylocystis sp. ATCC 49242 TaxID=622637 RepID=UPI0001F86D2C|nr:outer membrane beta-barrel protein [Methylocystis sp. ATCC 49242]